MTALPVEAVLVVFYGPTAHQVTYGRRVNGGGYTRDFIQLSKRPEFIEWAEGLFPRPAGAAVSVPLTYVWPGGSRPGHFVYESADRPHLKWDTTLGAPLAWRMASSPSESTAQTIPGDPGHQVFDDAEAEYRTLSAKGAGQPYLVAVKLRDQPGVLHVRAYLDGASAGFEWAGLELAPFSIQDLARQTTQRRALAWQRFESHGIVPTKATESAIQALIGSTDISQTVEELSNAEAAALADYLRDPGSGLFFDPDRNHDAWLQAPPIADDLISAAPGVAEILSARLSAPGGDDLTAESLPVDASAVVAYREQIEARVFSVQDSTSAVKVRGSAQRAFADEVKSNYGDACAVTGVTTRSFLVASHIVPWSKDETIRLDPSNGICLSLVVDRAFEEGYLRIEDDLTLRIDRARIGEDTALLEMLERHDGQKLREPARDRPGVAHLQRRRDIIDGFDRASP